jgi:hypothetical protein
MGVGRLDGIGAFRQLYQQHLMGDRALSFQKAIAPLAMVVTLLGCASRQLLHESCWNQDDLLAERASVMTVVRDNSGRGGYAPVLLWCLLPSCRCVDLVVTLCVYFVCSRIYLVLYAVCVSVCVFHVVYP